jgi:type II secretory pathway pseudopilin PulG
MATSTYSAKSSRNYSEDIHGLWRANAKERVAYTDDFPAQLLCATEFTDNSLAKGKATRIEWTFDITDPHAGIFTITDNGVGIQKVADLNRFLKFGSPSSSDKYHQYAWGRFRGMTAMMPEYEQARWSATFKLCGNPGFLSQVCQPWSAIEKMQQSMVEIPVTDENCNIGLQMKMHFDMSIFGADLAKQYLSNPQKLFDKTKERLTTKYHQSVFEHTEFVLSVVKDDMNITQSSKTHNWKTLEMMLFELSQTSPATCEIVYSNPLKWKSVDVAPIEFNLKRDHLELSKAFPTFGVRRLGTGRVNIFNDGRLIESRHRYKMEGRKSDHNDFNGQIVFLHSYSDCPGGDFKDQPEPCTTKVSIDENCENLKGIYAMFQAEKQRLKEEAAREEARKKKEREEERKAKVKETKAKAQQQQQQQQQQQAQAGGGAAAAARPSLMTKLPLSPLQIPAAPTPSTKQKPVTPKTKQAIPQTPSPPASPSLPPLISLVPLDISSSSSLVSPSSPPSPPISREVQVALLAMQFIMSPEDQAAFKVKLQETLEVTI